VVALIATLVLAAVVVLVPTVVSIGDSGPKPLWTYSYLNVEVDFLRVLSRIGGYPSVFWWITATIVATVVAVVAGIVAATGRHPKAGVVVATASLVAAASTIWMSVNTSQVGGFVADDKWSLAAWGVVAAAAVAMLAGLAVALPRGGAKQTLTIISILGMVAMGIAAVPLLHSSSPGFASDQDPSSGQYAPNDTDPPTTAPTTPASQLGYTYNFTETAANGYTFGGTVSLGAPQHFVQGLTQGQLTAGSACSIDAQTDAVVPAQLVLENTTKGFSAEPAVGLSWSGIGSVEVDFSDGPQCEANGSFTTAAGSAVPTGQAFTDDMFIVLPGYYSPASPDGDASALSSDQLQLTAADNNNDELISPTALAGPGATSAGGYSIPIQSSDADASSTSETTNGTTYPILQNGVQVMASPNFNSAVVGTVGRSDSVSIVCTTQGPTVTVLGWTTSVWDKVADPPGYVADAYVDTHTTRAMAAPC
jgi:hypothetical protein